MTDLDHLLMDDAERDRRDPPQARSLVDAVEHARVSTRRRYTLTTGLALTAVGVIGGSLLYTAAMPSRQDASDSRLAAYDHVIGPDWSRPGYILVTGPADKHTAHCTRVPGARIRLGVRDGKVSSMLVDFPKGLRKPAPHDNSQHQVQVDVWPVGSEVKDLPPGPFFLFRCPTT